MGAFRLGVLLGVFLCAATAPAAAQPPLFTGMLTGHIGPIAQGDISDWTVAPGLSLTAIDDSGFGAEFDISHAGDFDTVTFGDSSLTTVMLNFAYIHPHPKVRPFVVVGAGVLRVRVSLAPDSTEIGQTEPAWTVGGGAVYMLNETVGFRGDVRYFRHFSPQDTIPYGSNGVLDFIRTSVGVTLTWPILQ